MSQNVGNGDSTMKIWLWLISVLMGLTMAFGGALYAGITTEQRNIKADLKELTTKHGEQSIKIAEMSKDNSTITKALDDLKSSIDSSSTRINTRLDEISLALVRKSDVIIQHGIDLENKLEELNVKSTVTSPAKR